MTAAAPRRTVSHMFSCRLAPLAACAALFLLAGCGPKDAPDATPPAESGAVEPAGASEVAPATLPEVRYYQISDA